MSDVVAVPPNHPMPAAEQKKEVNASQAYEPTSNGDSTLASSAAEHAIEVQEKYASERAKRMREEEDAANQYLDLNILKDAKFSSFSRDPWLDSRSEQVCLRDGDRVKFLNIGAGLGGLLAGVKLVKDAGIDPSDVYTVDTAGGWGGTWYWNRYPGLMCDVNSYCYLPMLAETGFRPKHRYSYGQEIRQYINVLVERTGLDSGTMFRTTVEGAHWDDQDKSWVVKLIKERDGQADLKLTVRSQFLGRASGILTHLKLPNVKGLLDYKGHVFHTSRFDYSYTGGCQTDPQLTGLKDKRVGIIGTGSTGIQLVPELAKFAKELYVFQRTPSAVNVRDQAPTNAKWWQETTKDPKWQQARNEDFDLKIIAKSDTPNHDGWIDNWTNLKTFRANLGSEPVPPEDIPAFVAKMHTEDLPLTEQHRARVDQIVKDKDTAAKLKAWYPTYCKRPCFHDDYLPAFNQPNVHLVDTEGKGISRFTTQGIVANNTEYPLDLVIISTGFRSPAESWLGPTTGLNLYDRDSQCLDQKWMAQGMSTLHGLMVHGCPNLFLYGPGTQAGASANFGFSLDMRTNHTAYIVAEAKKRAGGKIPNTLTIEPTADAEEEWVKQIMMRVTAFSAATGCTPSYYNHEGMVDKMPMEAKMRMARASPWGNGFVDYLRVLKEWRAEGNMQGLEVKWQ